jgi:E3 ubiquitin-protein ligase DOA10
LGFLFQDIFVFVLFVCSFEFTLCWGQRNSRGGLGAPGNSNGNVLTDESSGRHSAAVGILVEMVELKLSTNSSGVGDAVGSSRANNSRTNDREGGVARSNGTIDRTGSGGQRNGSEVVAVRSNLNTSISRDIFETSSSARVLTRDDVCISHSTSSGGLNRKSSTTRIRVASNVGSNSQTSEFVKNEDGEGSVQSLQEEVKL